MAEAQLLQFLDKVNQLNAFVAMSEANPDLRQQLRDCSHHNEVVALAARHGFAIGKRWGEGTVAPNPTVHGDTNLLGGACPAAGQETTQILFEHNGLRIERIHSCQASSPDGFWYDQLEHEWVLLLQGRAQLQFEDEPAVRELCRGDSLWIAPGRRHRVVATDPAPGCVWVALFWSAAA